MAAGQRIWQVSAWDDPWFELLDSAHKVTFMYLVLGPNSRPSGLFVQSIRQMALALNADPSKVEAIMDDFAADGKVYRDEGRALVWVVNALAVNERMGMGPPMRRSVELDVVKYAASPLVERFLDRYPNVPRPSGIPSPTLTQGLTNPTEQEQEQEQSNPKRSSTGKPRAARVPDDLWDALVEALDLTPADIGKTRRGKLNAAVKELRSLGATPAEVKRRARAYQREHPQWAFTEMALVSHWAEFGRRTSKPIERVVEPEPETVPPPAEALAAMRKLGLRVPGMDGGTPDE